ncbi:DNA polymerase III subunit beta [Cytobacillus pseudoceanisediminis]|uniref:Beta sliding clamp n=2 Tax=Cytobacillus TaxID=2675230 RepID=A0A160ME73_9BACI|nr:DNA polymerase III subunit beta [Cytobacillus oceanisediminis]AND40848.1 DNA polymerase III subunit beta [Cytobacillus oceanisediminis 2691]MBU8729510.1 DNA polymerase III subunit beta [Cytobacillus oceanisediminis]MCM3245281.1 DNA polymerase III subunit beta [Cytobacillus oceanisediminis]QOK29346.1 DNA polymerase III subunit beta [Cytobacillus oceanisediminis]
MEFKIKNEYFNKAVGEVSSAISAKTPFPILTGIKLTACENHLRLTGSNSDIVIEKVIPAADEGAELEIVKTGSVVVTSRYLTELIKKLPGDIHIKVNEKHNVTIISDEIITYINGFPAEQYPKLPEFDNSHEIQISSVKLSAIIKQTVFAASKNDTRPVLTGVHMIVKENHFSCAATDSHRLAFLQTSIASASKGSFIVPGSSLKELLKLLAHQEESEVQIFSSESYLVFKTKSIMLCSRLIEGKYPDVTGLIPNEAKTVIKLDAKKLLKGIDRACLFALEWKNNNVLLEIKEGALKISSVSSAIGKIEETQPLLEITGERELSISLDGNFLMDALKAIQEEHVLLSFSGSMKPVIIKPVSGESYIQLVSPVRSY